MSPLWGLMFSNRNHSLPDAGRNREESEAILTVESKHRYPQSVRLLVALLLCAVLAPCSEAQQH